MAETTDNAARLGLRAIDSSSISDLVYESLKRAVLEMVVNADEPELRLDERRLAEELGVSRTPIREATARLEHEGLVRTVARRGIFVVQKTRQEIMEIITAWAALESMAARLLTERASDKEIASLRRLFATFGKDGTVAAHLDEYSEANLKFHKQILSLSGSHLLVELAGNLIIHMEAFRRRAIREDERYKRSIIDHLQIIEALETRDADLAERLVREHALGLAQHVAGHLEHMASRSA
jgi:DNA-binding GntR family transcriptional regulator